MSGQFNSPRTESAGALTSQNTNSNSRTFNRDSVTFTDYDYGGPGKTVAKRYTRPQSTAYTATKKTLSSLTSMTNTMPTGPKPIRSPQMMSNGSPLATQANKSQGTNVVCVCVCVLCVRVCMSKCIWISFSRGLGLGGALRKSCVVNQTTPLNLQEQNTPLHPSTNLTRKFLSLKFNLTKAHI